MKTELPKSSQRIKNKLGLIKSKILAVAEGKIDKIIRKPNLLASITSS